MSGVEPRISQLRQVLGRAEVQRLHDATLKLLYDEGVVFNSEAALAILRENSVRVEGKIARFPPALVEKAIETCPSEVILKPRRPNSANSLTSPSATAAGAGPRHAAQTSKPVLRRDEHRWPRHSRVLKSYTQQLAGCLAAPRSPTTLK